MDTRQRTGVHEPRCLHSTAEADSGRPGGQCGAPVLWPDPTDDSATNAGDFSRHQQMAAAIFDIIANHSDHGHNFAAAPSTVEPKRLRLYDNGYAFDFPGTGFGSAFFEATKGEVIPEYLIVRIEGFTQRASETELPQLLQEPIG
jgi:hypothetical protein